MGRESYRKLGEQLCELWTRKGWTVVACADHAGVARRTWERFEAGETEAEFGTLAAMFKLFGQQVWLRVGPATSEGAVIPQSRR